MTASTPAAASRHQGTAVIAAALGLLCFLRAHAETVAPPGATDRRVRSVAYDAGEVYRLRGFVGYQIDIEFETGESFVGLGAGDIDALSFVGRSNHLFLKPKAARVSTNVTVLTTRRSYQFVYTAALLGASTDPDDVTYVLRFRYARSAAQSAADSAARRLSGSLARGSADRRQNFDYWYCGDPALKPVSASDDGVDTRLRFGAHAELPAVFVRNDDGSESLLNFNIDAGDVVVQRVARRLIVRRGQLAGCIVNARFAGGGERLNSGTIAPDVERVTRGEADEKP